MRSAPRSGGIERRQTQREGNCDHETDDHHDRLRRRRCQLTADVSDVLALVQHPISGRQLAHDLLRRVLLPRSHVDVEPSCPQRATSRGQASDPHVVWQCLVPPTEEVLAPSLRYMLVATCLFRGVVTVEADGSRSAVAAPDRQRRPIVGVIERPRWREGDRNSAARAHRDNRSAV